MAEAKKTEAKEEKVKIKLPRTSKNDADVFVSVNERTWLIKRGVEVEVPQGKRVINFAQLEAPTEE